MRTFTYTAARSHLAEILNDVTDGEVIEITRRQQEPAVVMSKSQFDAMKQTSLNAEFDSLFSMFDMTNKALTNR